MGIFASGIYSLFIASAALADDAPPSPAATPLWRGIWAGSIGTEKIIACLDPAEDDGSSASGYYYLKHGEKIPLTAEGGQGVRWTEGRVAARTGEWILNPKVW